MDNGALAVSYLDRLPEPLIALIDADLVGFRCASTADEFDTPHIAIARTNEFVEKLLRETDAVEYELYMSGKGNFRYNIYPEYKANRIGAYRPKWEQEVREFLQESWGAVQVQGCEADDMLGVRATELGPQGLTVSIDKDQDQVPGEHYSWALTRHGEIIREAKRYFVTPEEGLRKFYSQLIIGDASDNIKGVKGKGKKVAAELDLFDTEQEMFNFVRDLYDNDEEFEMNAKLLWLWRKRGDIWQPPFPMN